MRDVESAAQQALVEVREAVSGYRRHSHAGRCEIAVRCSGDLATLEVLDDGVGLRRGQRSTAVCAG